MRKFLMALVALSFLSGSAEARPHRVHHYRWHGEGVRSMTISGKPAGCPSAWCGCWLRHNIGRDPGVQFNLARNWIHWGSASSLLPGAVVVYPHHVVKVVNVLTGGRFIGVSGNDSHQVKVRERSLRGSIGVRS